MTTTMKDTAGAVATETARRTATLRPAVDLFENDEQFTLVADLPGVSKDNLSVETHEDTLTIRGERPRAGGKTALRYERKFRLGDGVDQSGIQAELKQGVLRVRLPKTAWAQRRRITVQT